MFVETSTYSPSNPTQNSRGHHAFLPLRQARMGVDRNRADGPILHIEIWQEVDEPDSKVKRRDAKVQFDTDELRLIVDFAVKQGLLPAKGHSELDALRSQLVAALETIDRLNGTKPE